MSLPIIGVTTVINDEHLELPKSYINAISGAGGIPIVLPQVEDEKLIKAQMDSIDGLILSGGKDVDPELYGENPHEELGEVKPARDVYETQLIDYALDAGKPILGMCRGSHILNVHQGGTLYQDVVEQLGDHTGDHSQKEEKEFLSHEINIIKGTKLYDIVDEEKIEGNSFHHQANRAVPDHFIVSARANDGVIEAIESTEHEFVIGLQFHPESVYDAYEPSQRIFKRFIEVARKQMLEN